MARVRDRAELVRAKWRVSAEDVRPVAHLCAFAGASAPALVRWITEGKRGVYLDGYRHTDLGWVTSPAAVVRFKEAVNLAPTPAA